MKPLKNFDIEVFRLADSKHQFNYHVDETFFASLEDSIIEKGSLSAKITLDKSERLILATFQLKGTVEVLCDRSLEPYDQVIDSTEELVFKFGDEFQEVSENVVIIPFDLQKLNLAQYIYEYIGLSLPMKKLHPKYNNASNEEDEGETTLVYSSERQEAKEGESPVSVDPRWNALKELKNKLK